VSLALNEPNKVLNHVFQSMLEHFLGVVYTVVREIWAEVLTTVVGVQHNNLQCSKPHVAVLSMQKQKGLLARQASADHPGSPQLSSR
jgi:hypothetical protein